MWVGCVDAKVVEPMVEHDDDEVAPVTVPDVVLPLEQLMHDACAHEDWYLPLGQLMQLLEEWLLKLWYLPELHLLQVLPYTFLPVPHLPD